MCPVGKPIWHNRQTNLPDPYRLGAARARQRLPAGDSAGAGTAAPAGESRCRLAGCSCALTPGGNGCAGSYSGFECDTSVKPDKILLVEEIRAGNSLRSLLVRDDCRLEESALQFPAGAHQPDCYCLILFHVKQPSTLLLDVLRCWRDCAPQTTLLVVGNRTTPPMRWAILEAGAAAYLWGPVSEAELMARVRAAARRMHPPGLPTDRFALDGSIVDLDAHVISAPHGRIHLTPTECGILRHLSLHINRTVPFNDLVTAVWGTDPQKGVHSLRRFIRELRQKLEPHPPAPKYLVTEPSVGYRLQTKPECPATSTDV
jgi:two-component system KDP operon response regulator KdpE